MDSSRRWIDHVDVYVWRWLALILLGALGIVCYQRIREAGSAVSIHGSPYLWPGLGVALVAVLGAWLVLGTRVAGWGKATRYQWIELGLIIGIGLLFRAQFFFVPPTISHDAYRYVWDAHLVSHGVSPYLYPASAPSLRPLRDGAIWPNLNWPNSPTVYPPGAELIFLLVNMVAPLNITAMQLAMIACDIAVGLVTLLLLHHFHLDLRRIIIYWWNPIPVLEFVYSAHIDAAAALLVAVALLLALQHWRGARLLAGVALGMAVLIKLYPLLFVVALLRRKDWGFLLGFTVTIVGVTLPFLHLGLGTGGFLGTYFSQRFVDEGLIFRFITTLVASDRWQLVLQGTTLLLLTGTVLIGRLRWGLPAVAAILALSATWILVSPHLYPWYMGGILPLLAIVLQLPTGIRHADHERSDIVRRWRIPSMPYLAFWLFLLEIPFTYVIFAPGFNANLFLLFFAVPIALASMPLWVGVLPARVRTSLDGRLDFGVTPSAVTGATAGRAAGAGEVLLKATEKESLT